MRARFRRCASAAVPAAAMLLACAASSAQAPNPPGPAAASAARAPIPTAAPFVVNAWGIDDNLPQNSVTTLLRARSGYLWIGTNGGVARFDGVRFTVYSAATTPRLPNDRVSKLAEDHAGTIWVGTQIGGLASLSPDGHAETFTPREGLPGNGIGPLLVDRTGTLWVGTDGGLFRREGRRFVRDPSIPPGDVRVLTQTSDGAIWVGTGRDLYRLGASGVVLRAEGSIQEVIEGKDGALWVASFAGVQRRTPQGFRTLAVPGPAWSWAVSMSRNAQGDVAVATPVGVLLYNAEGTAYRTLTTRDGLRSNLSSQVLFDRDGTLWSGTIDAGLHRLRAPAFQVYQTPHPSGKTVSISVSQDRAGDVWVVNGCEGVVRVRGGVAARVGADEGLTDVHCPMSVLEDRQGRHWAGTLGGLRVREPGAARFAPHAGPLATRQVTGLYEDRAGALWVSLLDGLARLWNGRVTEFSAADGLPGTAVRGVLEGRDGTLFVATDGGVGRLLRGRQAPLTTAQGLASNDVRALHEDARGGLWIGTYGSGLHLYRQGRIHTFTTADGLPENVVSALLEDAEGFFWMTGNRGITRVARAALEARADGARGRLNAYLFGQEAGIPNPETTGGMQPAAWKGRDGRMWFPTFSGAAVVDPAGLVLGPPPSTAVEAVVTPSRTWLASGPLALPRGVRQFDVAYTGFDLANASQTRFRYRLRGAGADTAWVEAGTRRVAYFTNVAPGDYTFEVAAAGLSGAWTPRPATLRLTVPPYPGERPWVRGLLGLLFVGAVAWAVRARLQRLATRSAELERAVVARTSELRQEKTHADAARLLAEEQRALAESIRGTVEAQAAELQSLDAAKNRFFTNLSHELRTPLTLILGPIEAAAHERRLAGDTDTAGELDTTLRSARRLLRLLDQLLDLARLESRALPFQPVEGDIVGFVRELLQGFVPLAAQRGVTLDLRAPDAPLPIVFDPDALEKVVFNLVSNALKFTPAGGRIAVRVSEARSGGAPGVRMSVRDTGAGVAPDLLPRLFDRFYQTQPHHARNGAGIGLALARELVDLHGGRIDVESEVGFGSTFTVTLPAVPPSGADRRSPADPAVEAAEAPPTGEALRREVLSDGRVAAAPAPAPSPPRRIATPDPTAPAAVVPAAVVPEAGVPDAAPVAGVPEAALGEATSEEAAAIAPPVALQPESKLAPVAAPVPSVLPLVLVVEDHDEVRAFVRRHLSPLAHVIEAPDGEAGLRLALERRPALVVSDVAMPGLDGVELCRRLKADPRTALTPVLLLTAQASPDRRVVGLDAGADDYLVKPFVVRELQARVENLLRSRVQLREAYGRTVAFTTSGVPLASADEQFVERVREVLAARLADPDFDIPALAAAVGVSLSQLHRRVKALTGQPPVQLLRTVRLARAADLLGQRVGGVAEVAFAVGFNSLSYFARCFREQYGVSPSDYRPDRAGASAAEASPSAADPVALG